MMTAAEIRRKYLDFFKRHGHYEIRSASVIPENDPTCLFTTAGMHPLVPYLSGQSHPNGRRLTDCQKCIRTGDIDEVGDAVHLTFFEMLGNWSLGDYFKEEAIAMSFEFLTEELGLPLDMLAFTVFAGDEDAPFDEEAFGLWRSHGVAAERIAKLPKKDNWWGPAGVTGPCGPDTEMFYWTGEGPAPKCFDPADKRWVEIWNDVFMQYNKNAEGKFEPLAQRNVDTGMGLERVTAVLQGKKSCYETEIFAPIFAELDAIRGVAAPASAADRTASERIIADHLRASAVIIADGITPGRVDQPYVLRRLIRRAIREGRKLGIENAFVSRIASVIIDRMGGFYPELVERRAVIVEELDREEKQFAATLGNGIKELQKLIDRVPAFVERKVISGKNAFNLYETYGFPIELTTEMAKEQGFSIDLAGYEEAYRRHQEQSRAGAEQKFKGGLADHSEATARLHSATHLLQAALRRVLGSHVEQRGSNITAERLRFDFSHPDKVTPEQLAEVEKLVNEAIAADVPVICREMPVEEARKTGAMGLFGNRYGDVVKVYSMGDFSCEICGGPHANRTGELGRFRILKEESSSRGVRRIKAVLEQK